ncbi:hypothetical protein NUW54_g5562 [Trametes sanguinea]|uniref:Uncharacterized protein n=1 Tax=Trametes sanguinea TaxID=158606 RepID=A0ACC1PUT4_9APHY|nr:hypothetical protein NUW54_g5562 [Trametes sanguinea]
MPGKHSIADGYAQAHTVRVIDVSKERKTAANFLAHIEDTLKDVKEKWNVEVVGFTSDASGESRAARLELLSKYTYLIVLDCYAHQINLIVGDYFDSKSTLLDVTDQAEELITWLRRRTFILARIRDVQQSHGKTALAVIRPVLTRWTSHYLAFRRLLELQSTLSYIIADDNARGGTSTFMVGLNTSAAKNKARQMIALMQNGAFWHSLNRVKLHLEPLAVAANVTQAAHCRLDQVLLIFGFLYRRFLTLPSDLVDDVASRAVIDSIETRWSKADQAIFVAAVILNPMYHLDPFADHPQFIQIELEKLFARLWTRFYRTTPPTELYIDLREYLEFKGRFSTLPEHVKLRMEHARQQRKHVDPVELWRATGRNKRPQRPLAQLACRLLSVCANSASCERLFSIFGQLLTKLRNRLGTNTLANLAELKMHVRDEYTKTSGMKERLRTAERSSDIANIVPKARMSYMSRLAITRPVILPSKGTLKCWVAFLQKGVSVSRSAREMVIMLRVDERDRVVMKSVRHVRLYQGHHACELRIRPTWPRTQSLPSRVRIYRRAELTFYACYSSAWCDMEISQSSDEPALTPEAIRTAFAHERPLEDSVECITCARPTDADRNQVSVPSLDVSPPLAVRDAYTTSHLGAGDRFLHFRIQIFQLNDMVDCGRMKPRLPVVAILAVRPLIKTRRA